jgi:hypothetical protein
VEYKRLVILLLTLRFRLELFLRRRRSGFSFGLSGPVDADIFHLDVFPIGRSEADGYARIREAVWSGRICG